MVTELDEAYGKPNATESQFCLKNAWHAARVHRGGSGMKRPLPVEERTGPESTFFESVNLTEKKVDFHEWVSASPHPVDTALVVNQNC